MSTSGYIFKRKSNYDEKKMLNDIDRVIIKAKLYRRKEVDVKYKINNESEFVKTGIENINFKENIFRYAYFNIFDKEDIDIQKQEKSECTEIKNIIFCVNCIENGILDSAPEWLNKEKHEMMCGIAYIEEIYDNEQLIYKLIYEYLKINPDDVFWVEEDWVYTLEDMERLHKLPYNENWCYEKPSKYL